MAAELTTLCYLIRDGKYLMLHRTVKHNDVNKDKWIGVGGHFEADESPEECVIREVREETGYTLLDWKYRGIVTFISGTGVTEYMSLFTSDRFTGTPADCDEGHLEWIGMDRIPSLNLWAGDLIFFRLLDEGSPFFSLKLVYNGNGVLREAVCNGVPMELFDILDPETGRKTGAVQERGVVHREGYAHATVHMWIVRRQGSPSTGIPGETPAGRGCGTDVLLQLRASDKDSHPDCFDTSSAGHIQAGDNADAPAVREIGEELGLRCTAAEFLPVGIHVNRCDDVFYGRPFHDCEWSHVYVFDRPFTAGDLTLQKSEIRSVCWMDLEDCLRSVRDGSLRSCISADELEMVKQFLHRKDQ